jgi:hypothetical protein
MNTNTTSESPSKKPAITVEYLTSLYSTATADPTRSNIRAYLASLADFVLFSSTTVLMS